MSQYCKEYYGVPSDIGRRITYNGEGGIIYKDGGNYVAVNLDSDKVGHTVNIHPTDENLVYLEMGESRKTPKLTRSQQNYRDYLSSECDETFAEYMGFI